ncbi:hypothetical protein D9M68_597110 [compost metagenome]
MPLPQQLVLAHLVIGRQRFKTLQALQVLQRGTVEQPGQARGAGRGLRHIGQAAHGIVQRGPR